MSILMPAAGAVITLGTAYLTIKKIAKDAKKDKKEQSAEILHAAKEEDVLMRSELQNEINEMKFRIESMEKSIEKDISHLKETYGGEMKSLSDKIEHLRDELRSQHSNIVGLLSKMIDNSKD